jgi:nucleoid-associated protein YgaU
VVVQPGESLWRIARHAYGQGIRYTVIFAANHDQIRDPDLIYPGQAFAVPQNASAIPASASNSR